MKTELFDFNLPETLIAQHPIDKRDHSRLLVMNKETGALEIGRASCRERV